MAAAIIALLSLYCSSTASAGVSLCAHLEGAGPRIRSVTVVANEIFEGAGGWPYQLANKLHVGTRESVVRNELLFAPGDPLDGERLDQSARNLRALGFFRDAAIVASPATEDSEAVDVAVSTWDAWTLSPQLALKKLGNRWAWDLGLAEKNFLGYGKHVELSYRSEIDRDSTRLFLRDPQIAGSQWELASGFAEQSDGRRLDFRLHRPFVALDTRWGYGGRIEAFDQLQPLYESGERVGELKHVRRLGEVGISRALSSNAESKSAVRLHLGYRKQEDRLENESRNFGILLFGVSSVTHDFAELSYLNRFGATEDVNLGAETNLGFGVSSELFGGEPENVFFFNLSRKQTLLDLGPGHWLASSMAWSARHRRGQIENSMVDAQLDYIRKPAPRWVFAGAARLLLGANLDPEVQLTLGVNNGLRGYPANGFVGDRSLLLSLEQRWFLIDDIAQLVSVGAALFMDSGHAWTLGQGIDLGDLKTNLGVSILLGRDRLSPSSPIARVNFAYALVPVSGGSRWLISFGNG